MTLTTALYHDISRHPARMTPACTASSSDYPQDSPLWIRAMIAASFPAKEDSHKRDVIPVEVRTQWMSNGCNQGIRDGIGR